MLSNHGQLLHDLLATKGINIVGSRFNAIVDGLHAELTTLFVNKWTEAYSAEHIGDPAYEADRLALIACALDPQTWVLEECVSETLAARVKEHLRQLFMAEYNRENPQNRPRAEGRLCSFPPFSSSFIFFSLMKCFSLILFLNLFLRRPFGSRT